MSHVLATVILNLCFDTWAAGPEDPHAADDTFSTYLLGTGRALCGTGNCWDHRTCYPARPFCIPLPASLSIIGLILFLGWLDDGSIIVPVWSCRVSSMFRMNM